MTQYKFRGQQVGTGKWVYGSLLSCEDSLGPIYHIMVQHKFPFTREHFLVRMETVGQWTGLKDKNGEELYEGDIYQSLHFPEHRFVVMFISGAFVGGKNENTCSPIGWVDEDQSNQNWIRKIGNIHDNPELNPAKGAVTNTMNTDPNNAQAAPANQESIAEQAAAGEAANAEAVNEQANAVESAAQDAAVGATEE